MPAHLRPCLTCGRPARGPRCPDHDLEPLIRATYADPAYHAERTRLLADVHDGDRCPLCLGLIIPGENLQTDHDPPLIERLAAGERDITRLVEGMRVVHAHCNARAGATVRAG